MFIVVCELPAQSFGIVENQDLEQISFSSGSCQRSCWQKNLTKPLSWGLWWRHYHRDEVILGEDELEMGRSRSWKVKIATNSVVLWWSNITGKLRKRGEGISRAWSFLISFILLLRFKLRLIIPSRIGVIWYLFWRVFWFSIDFCQCGLSSNGGQILPKVQAPWKLNRGDVHECSYDVYIFRP